MDNNVNNINDIDFHIKIACDALSNQIKAECNSDKIDTARVNLLIEELRRLESISVTSISNISSGHIVPNGFPVVNRPTLMFDDVPPRNSVFDSLSDVANAIFKKNEADISISTVDNMIRWLHFLDEVEPNLIDRSIVSSKNELNEIRDSILTVIIKDVRRKTKEILSPDGDEIYANNINEV